MLITNPEFLSRFAPETRLWQGIPTIEVTPKGRIFVAYYSGKETETFGNYSILTGSDDNGKTFRDPIAIVDVGEEERSFDPCLWIDPKGRLWFVWAVMPNNRVEYVICDDPDADELVFSEIRTISGEVMLNKPTVLSDGRWLFPTTIWPYGVFPLCPGIKGRETGALAVISEDEGKTFKTIARIEAENRCFDEHMYLEKQNGDIELYIRTYYGIALSVSKDGGYTWSEDRDSRLGGPCSRFFIRRLSSGNLLLINHYKYRARNNLTAMVSRDDGATWEGFLRIDPRGEVSYPDAVERNGKLYIVHDRERGAIYDPARDYSKQAREILLSVITEEEILQGKLSREDSYLCAVISKLTRPIAPPEAK